MEISERFCVVDIAERANEPGLLFLEILGNDLGTFKSSRAAVVLEMNEASHLLEFGSELFFKNENEAVIVQDVDGEKFRIPAKVRYCGPWSYHS